MSELLQLYGHPLSQPVRSVQIFCDLSKIPYNFNFVDLLKRDNLSDDFTKINPFQEVPAIVHGSFAVWESSAIVVYLADAYNVDNNWYPKNIQTRARINAFLHWHHENLRAPIAEYVRAKVLFPKFFRAPKLSKENEEVFQKRVKELLETLSWILKDHKYIARTQHPTIADVFAYSEIATGFAIPIDLKPYPAVHKWFAEIGNVPAVKTVHEFLFKLNKIPQDTPKL